MPVTPIEEPPVNVTNVIRTQMRTLAAVRERAYDNFNNNLESNREAAAVYANIMCQAVEAECHVIALAQSSGMMKRITGEKSDPTDEQLEEIRRASKQADHIEPRAEKAWLYFADNSLNLELKSGVSVRIPMHLIQASRDATAAQIGNVELSNNGYAIQFPLLDVQLAVPDLVRGVYGDAAWMEKLAQERKQQPE